LYVGLAEAELNAQADIRGAHQLLINGVPLEFYTFRNVRDVLSEPEIGELFRMIANDPEASEKQAALTSILKRFGMFVPKQFVVGIEGGTIYYYRNRNVR
jgi:hypothetical protein